VDQQGVFEPELKPEADGDDLEKEVALIPERDPEHGQNTVRTRMDITASSLNRSIFHQLFTSAEKRLGDGRDWSLAELLVQRAMRKVVPRR
jgi:hypothetical protein